MDANSRVSDAIDAELMLLNIETAADISRRSDFFSWVQGGFQAVLPHDGLVCGVVFPAADLLTFEWMGGYPVSEETFARLSDTKGGLCYGLVKTWEQAGREPLAVGGASGPGAPPEEAVLMDQLQHQRLTNCLAHGVAGVDGKPISFFELFNLPAPPGVREKRMLQLFVPYLYTAWLRATALEARQWASLSPAIAGVLTAREVDVLSLVREGKTNKQIASRLGVRDSTVDTHMERIFRKLKVSSRAQAAVKGTELNLTLGPGPQWRYYR